MYNDCLIFKFLGFKCAEEKAASKMLANHMTVKIFRHFITLEIQSYVVNEHVVYFIPQNVISICPNWSAMHKPLKIFTMGAREYIRLHWSIFTLKRIEKPRGTLQNVATEQNTLL